MRYKKIMLVFGTRPEAIKMAPLIKILKQKSDKFQVVVCVTAQHRQMLDHTLSIFDIVPDIDLNLMKKNQDLFDITALILTKMRDVFLDNRPDIVIVHGDTTTTFATALASYYSNIPLAHVEAGLRTRDLNAPFPEEFNRQVTSKLAQWHFAPTEINKTNLVADGVDEKTITVTGNTVIDSLQWLLSKIDNNPKKASDIQKALSSMLPFNWQIDKFVLITGHRRENFGEGFLEICYAIRKLASKFTHIHFVYPVHLNPNVSVPVNELLFGFNNVHLISPLTYEPFIYLLRHSYFVLTDSGGIQEEAPSLNKPVLVMRDVTERTEAIHSGVVKLVGAKRDRIINAASRLLVDETHYKTMCGSENPFGDGTASKQIVSALENLYN
jgi:UDP-N-acetylglucosamine 2-epimerase (non-hydrolysing)